jgi:gamma-glutamylcysteine synthetase
VEFPYGSAFCAPQRAEGRATIYKHVKAAIAPMQNLTFTNIRQLLSVLVPSSRLMTQWFSLESGDQTFNLEGPTVSKR